jgi:hypothetical protein
MRCQIYRCEVEAGYRALEKKDFTKAKKIFTGPYLSKAAKQDIGNWKRSGRSERYKWTSSQYHGNAVAHIGLKDWDKALEHIERAKNDHILYFRHDHDNKPCKTYLQLENTHSQLLDKLGRNSEARIIRSRMHIEPTDYPTDFFRVLGYDRPYEKFEDKLAKLSRKIKF